MYNTTVSWVFDFSFKLCIYHSKLESAYKNYLSSLKIGKNQVMSDKEETDIALELAREDRQVEEEPQTAIRRSPIQCGTRSPTVIKHGTAQLSTARQTGARSRSANPPNRAPDSDSTSNDDWSWPAWRPISEYFLTMNVQTNNSNLIFLVRQVI